VLYVILMNFTEQGIRNVEVTIERAKSYREIAKSEFDSEVKEIYWTLGSYDVMAVVDSPDEKTATALALALASKGDVRTQTMRAFNEDEMSEILSKIS
jgi:uncharacterized protein with GYD domain